VEDVKVSIIVPSYRRDEYFLSRSLNSLLTQTYQNIEIVLVCDNALEKNAEYRAIVEKMVNDLNSDKITFIQNQENLGASGTRNAGIEIAAGTYITFLDDDDKYLPQKVERQLNFMLENDLDMSFTDLRIHDQNDKLVEYREHSKIKSFDNDTLMRYHLTRQIAGVPTFMYKKSHLVEIGGFEQEVSFGEEYYLMYNTIDKEIKIGYLSGSDIVAYREGHEHLSRGDNMTQGATALLEFKKSKFNQLSFSERRFVKFRHSAVKAVIYKRNGKSMKSFWQVVGTGFRFPILSIREFFGFFGRRRKVRREAVND